MLDLIENYIAESKWLCDNSATIIEPVIRGDESLELVYEKEALVDQIQRYANLSEQLQTEEGKQQEGVVNHDASPATTLALAKDKPE